MFFAYQANFYKMFLLNICNTPATHKEKTNP